MIGEETPLNSSLGLFTSRLRPLDANSMGGPIGFPEYSDSSPLKPIVDRWRRLLKGEDWDFVGLRDPDFVENFVVKIPNAEEQDKYVLNTAAYSRNSGNDGYDPKYVLLFRRSLPSEVPKPEQYWTTEYIAAVRGLNQEISGPHRLYSVILSTTLEELQSLGFVHDVEPKGSTDGEVKINAVPFDQSKCITRFMPKDQQRELEKYQKSQDAMSLQDVLKHVGKMKVGSTSNF